MFLFPKIRQTVFKKEIIRDKGHKKVKNLTFTFASLKIIKVMSLKEIINQASTTIVDVRTPGEFMSGHVANAINIPLNEVPDRMEEFKALSKPVVVCCLSGGRSGQAAAFLKANGLDEVYNGGGWMEVNGALM
ncbi:MAG: rhodanese-like domain-containing protein [Chitinophagales bacterium]|nr:rhodanese-like domain-containing protein [Chitinophagales bacterium]